MFNNYIAAIFFFSISVLSQKIVADSGTDIASARRLVGLVDYISSDYRGAVKGGVIIDEFEYNEMQEFCDLAIKLFALSVDPKNDQTLLLNKKLSKFRELIKKKKRTNNYS